MNANRPLHLLPEPVTRVGRDADTGVEFLLTIYGDGSHWLATRVDSSATWGPEVELRRIGGAA